MKPRARAIVAAIAVATSIALALGGCASPGPSVSDPRLHGTWHLASGSVNGKGIPIGARSVTLDIGDSTHTGGTSPCSSYTASVIGGVGVVYIRAAFTSRTRDTCTSANLASLEEQYISALTSTRFASINQGALVLTSPETMLVFVRTEPTSVANVVLTRWQLYAIPGQNALVTTGEGTHPVYLSFDGSDGFTVHSNCEAISGSYLITGENFDLSHFAIQTLSSSKCNPMDRSFANQIETSLYGSLLLDISKSSGAGPATLVITNADDDLPLVWRAET